MSYGLDITELVNSDIGFFDFIDRYISKFRNEVKDRIGRFV